MLRCISTETISVPRPVKFTLDKREIVVGRDTGNVDILLDSTKRQRMISRVHARLVRREDGSGGYSLVDNNSMNKCYVNKERVVGQVDLNDGDVIIFGVAQADSEFIFKYEAPPPPPAPEPTPVPVPEQQPAPGAGTGDASAEVAGKGKRKRRRKDEGIEASFSDDEGESQWQWQESQSESQLDLGADPGADSKRQRRPRQPRESSHKLADDLANDLQCVVCQELYFGAVTLPCSHSFCGECIEEWCSRIKSECPVCRAEVDANHPWVPARALDTTIAKMVSRLKDDVPEKKEYNRRMAEKGEEDSKIDMFRRLMAKAREDNFKILDITKRWSRSETEAFISNIKQHSGRVRQLYCDTAKLTWEFVTRGAADQINLAVQNLGLPMGVHQSANRNALKKFYKGES